MHCDNCETSRRACRSSAGLRRSIYKSNRITKLEDGLVDAIKTEPGQKALEIAGQLGIDGKQVNSALYGPLKSKVKQDNAYRWYPKGPSKSSDSLGGSEKTHLSTPVVKLCPDELDCLRHDDVGGDEFACSK